MASVNFLYRSTKCKANLNLRLLFRHNSKDFVFGAKTQFEIERENWFGHHAELKGNKKKGIRKVEIKKTNDVEVLNRRLKVNIELNKIENYVLNAFKSANPYEISKNWLQNQIDCYYNPKTEINIPTNLVEYISFYIDYRKNELKPTSIKKFNVIKNKLIRFETYRKNQILIKDINDSFKVEFVKYQKKEFYSQNTIQRELVLIKTFCKHARFLGLDTHYQLDSLRVERQKVDKIYLTVDDLIKIESFDKDKLTKSLDNAKDWLVISCYTGQRISDFMRFTDEQIRVENGNSLLEFTQKKTGKNMTVPLHPIVLEILKKRGGKFPYVISDQKYNDYIKEVCRLAGINDRVEGSKVVELESGHGFRKKNGVYYKWELVSSHVGRRSFATNFYGKMPTTYLIYVTGHSTETMFLSYIGKSNKDLAMEMTKYF